MQYVLSLKNELGKSAREQVAQLFSRYKRGDIDMVVELRKNNDRLHGTETVVVAPSIEVPASPSATVEEEVDGHAQGIESADESTAEDKNGVCEPVPTTDDQKKHAMYQFIQAMDKKAKESGTPYVLLLDQVVTNKIGWSRCDNVKQTLRKMLQDDPSHFERFCKVRKNTRLDHQCQLRYLESICHVTEAN